MKKSILYICATLLIIAPLSAQVPVSDPVSMQSIDSAPEEPQKNNEFEDFFGVDEEPPSADGVPRPKKEKLSRLQILMMQMGVSLALVMESVYIWACAVWARAASLVKHDRKA